jgi:hypothetical protein
LTDKTKSFHPFGLVVTREEKDVDFHFMFVAVKETVYSVTSQTYTPKILIADNAEAITNGFQQSFPLEKRINCWAHVIRKIDSKLKPVAEPNKSNIRKDICSIQVLFNKHQFDIALQLFFKKWKAKKDSNIDTFLAYFKQQWCSDGNNGWYEGYAEGYPSTTNALESIHKYMKRGLLGCRLGLIRFLNSIEDGLVKLWSTDRKSLVLVEENGSLTEQINKNYREFHKHPLIDNKDWKDAYTWNKKNKKILNVNSKFFIPVGKDTELSKSSCESYLHQEEKEQWRSFDEMIKFINSLHVVQVDFSSWQLSKCNCSYWVKNYKCNHVISVCYRLYKSKSLSDQHFMDAIMNLPIEANRKRGRPALTTQAELRQPNEEQNEESDIIDYMDAEPLAKKKKADSKKAQKTNAEPTKRGRGRPKKK